jgi:hypothetical protein
MGTETLQLIATAAGQILRTKATVTKSRNSIERCRRHQTINGTVQKMEGETEIGGN